MYSPTTDPIISTQDDEGVPIVFTKAKWVEKKDDHPELMDSTFISNVQRTMEAPDEVWPDYADYKAGKSDRQCYYCRYSPYIYVKVVVWVNTNPRRVVTAYQIDAIKESKYTELTRLR